MKLQTINVIEITEDGLLSVRSFSEDDDGVAEAEKFFKDILKEQEPEFTEEDIESYLKDGLYERNGYELYIANGS